MSSTQRQYYPAAVADEWLLSRVPADVCLKVGCLSIHLGAVGIVAPVLFLSLRAVTAPSSPSGGGGGGNTDNTACVY